MLTSELGKYFNASPYFAGLTGEGPAAAAEFPRLFSGLSPQSKQLMVSGSTADFLYGLAEKYRLYDFEVRRIGQWLRHIILNKIRAADMLTVLAETLGSSQKATAIFREIVDGLLRPAGIIIARAYPGQDLPETGGNIINLRNQK